MPETFLPGSWHDIFRCTIVGCCTAISNKRDARCHRVRDALWQGINKACSASVLPRRNSTDYVNRRTDPWFIHDAIPAAHLDVAVHHREHLHQLPCSGPL